MHAAMKNDERFGALHLGFDRVFAQHARKSQ